MFDDYVSADTTPLYKSSSGSSSIVHLLWGDGVRFVSGSTTNGRRKVKTRGGVTGWVTKSALDGESLLEFYFIDVGQGDGVLIKTPNFRHIMIDGGFPRSVQDTGKNAADFVDWKFVKDYGKSKIALDTMLVSHCDADHYGGLWNLLDVSKINELDASGVSVEEFFHAGLSWWKKGSSKTLGPSISDAGESFGRDCLAIVLRSVMRLAAVRGRSLPVGGTTSWKRLMEPRRRMAIQPKSIV